MKRKKRLLIGIGMAFAVAAVLSFLNPADLNAQETRIIRISGGVLPGSRVKELRLEPQTLLAEKGSVVIWHNFARGTEIKVIIEEGKTCQDVTAGASGFQLDEAKNCYVTSWISLGGTSSLKFDTPGRFKYIVEASADSSVKARGDIVVMGEGSGGSTWPK